ncbi:MAG: ABC transporter ATP-binding protein [Gammaproteobacteria bacterium]|nr:MAG: ABC transporter ATP-binding protein [Gammaproteobacteria bacterium]
MSSEPVIRIQHLSKAYRIYNRPIDRVLESILHRSRIRKSGSRFREIQALKPVDLEIYPGETIGIIGQNGSGKSTLLQIISGTLYPSTGTVEVNGRLSALLELGAGFNPNFSGRENAYLNGSIMGISGTEMDSRFDDILEFSGIGDFIDQPVKTYSSGMYVRLAFAVAIHMDPDILVVDEALSVGDVRFQNKCFRKLRELKSQGTTTLFVTHSSDLIVRHCDRAVLLEKGAVIATGEPADVVNEYLNLLFNTEEGQVESAASNAEPQDYDEKGLIGDRAIDGCRLRPFYNAAEYRWGDQRGQIQDYVLLINGEPTKGMCQSGDRINLLLRIVFKEDVLNPILGLTLKTSDGIAVYGANTRERKLDVPAGRAGSELLVRYSFDICLIGGDYFISLGLADDDAQKDNLAVDRRYDLIHIQVKAEHSDFGISALNMDISIDADGDDEERYDS